MQPRACQCKGVSTLLIRSAKLIFATDIAITLISVVTSLIGARALGPAGRGDLLVITLWPLVIAMLAFVLAEQKWKTAALCFLGFHLHLFEDLLGSRGPDGDQWPIPYLLPLSSAANLTWHGQWALNAWPNFVITMALLGMTFYLAWQCGYSPMEMVSERADRALVAALRKRFQNARA